MRNNNMAADAIDPKEAFRMDPGCYLAAFMRAYWCTYRKVSEPFRTKMADVEAAKAVLQSAN